MNEIQKNKRDELCLITAKRERQAESRVLVESGVRTQESMYLIAPAIARAAVVEHRTFSFD